MINAVTEHCRGKSNYCQLSVEGSTNLFHIEPDRTECYVVDYDVYLTETQQHLSVLPDRIKLEKVVSNVLTQVQAITPVAMDRGGPLFTEKERGITSVMANSQV